jgi:predicted SprT family Zn-dependent metalloprotease
MQHTEQTLLAALQQEFERLNSTHFDGRLSPPRIEISRRKTFGGYYQKQTHRIVLSWQAYAEHGWDETLNTFRHEVAHIVHFRHDKAFWELAYRLGVAKKYAANPIKPRKRRVYVYACPSCGAQMRRCRRFRNASCASCDRNYNPKFKLKLIHVTEPA